MIRAPRAFRAVGYVFSAMARAVRQSEVEYGQSVLETALVNGDDLDSTLALLDDIAERRQPGWQLATRSPPPRPLTPDEQQRVCLYQSLCAAEQFDLARAERELGRVDEEAAIALVRARLSLMRGQLPELPNADTTPFSALVEADTRVQLALARGDRPSLDEPCFAQTRARVLAYAGRDDEAIAILRALAPSRLSALRAAFPHDAAVRLLDRRETSPYR